MKTLRCGIPFLYLGVMFATVLWGQSSTGQIDVAISDQSEAMVGDARITVTGAATGAVARTGRTNAAGMLAVPLLNPGTYDIKVEREGFKTLLRKGIVLRVTEVVSLRLKLELGAATQSVTIAGEAPLVDSSSNAQGQVVAESTMQQLPLNGRNYTQLAVLTAGTVPSVNKDQSFSAYGNRGMQNVYLLDGGLNESFIRGIDNHARDALRPALEAIQEFKVQTSNFSAEYGASAGGVVSVVTKSGTNEIHGSAFDFLRNSAISARDYFAPAGPVPQLIYNQFGGAMGGPIKKNRAWIFGAYQGTQIRQQTTVISTVPTAAMKSGVFPNAIYDPNSTTASGSGFIRTPYANNTVPAASFNSIGKTLVQTYPDPNRAGSGNNYIRNAPFTTAAHNFTFRGDVQVTEKDNMFARFSFIRSKLTGAAALPEPAGSSVAQQLPAWNFGYGYTRVFGPTLVNEFRFSWSRPEVTKDATLARNEIIPNALAPGVDSSTPSFGVTGYVGLGGLPAGLGNVPLSKTSAVWEVSDNGTKNLGSHLLKFGYTHQLVKMYTFTTLSGRGSFGFDGSYTQNPQSRPGTGSGVADMLLGLAQTATTSTTGVSDLRMSNDYFYVQDDWKVSQRLTLNLGVRYELYFPIYDINNKYGNFVLDQTSPDYGHLVFAGLNGQSRSLMTVDKNNFAPRVGFAYRVPHSKDLVIRGGYGIFYGNPDEQIGVGVMMTNNQPFVGVGSVNLIGDKNQPSTAFNLSGKLPATSVVAAKDFTLNPASTTSLYSWQQYYVAPLEHQWNLSIQKQLPGAMVVELGYVGNTSRGNWNSYPDNQPLIPGPGGVATRRPLAKYTVAPVTTYAPWNRGHYEGMTARLEKRMTHGLFFLASFTYGRAIDLSSGAGLDGCGYCGAQESVQNSYNLSGQRGPSDSNVPRRFVFSTNWDLPFGKGKRFLQKGVGAIVAGGWQASGIWTAQDGSPFTVNLPIDNVNVGHTSWPNRVCDGRLANPSVLRWYDTACFVTPPLYTFGNAGRNPLYGPGMNNIDFSVHRYFPIPFRESMKLEFRGEFFNAFNHPQFGMPAYTLGQAQTAQITTTTVPNRQVQFALKLLW
jgi:hypothetical protein